MSIIEILQLACAAVPIVAVFVWKGKLDKTVQYWEVDRAESKKDILEIKNTIGNNNLVMLERIHKIELQLARMDPTPSVSTSS